MIWYDMIWYIYMLKKSVFWPPLAFFVVSNLSTFFGSNFNNRIRNPDTTCKRQQKTTRDNFSIVSTFVHPIVCNLSIQNPDFCQKMGTKYWQSRGQITDYQISVFSFKNDLTKLSKTLSNQVFRWSIRKISTARGKIYRPFTRPPP